MVEEVEIMATNKVLKKSSNVSNTYHCESIVAKSDGEYGRRKCESVPEPPPHNKTPSHSRMQVSETSEQFSQINEKRTKKINLRESPATKANQNTWQAASRDFTIHNDSSEA